MYPHWVVLHVPHDSTDVPSSVRDQFLLNDIELATEIGSMTDHQTLALFSDAGTAGHVVRAPVSRLVVDVERFAQDDDEPMASRGMGAIYTVTSRLNRLRRPLTVEERNVLMQNYYIPHHQRLESAVASAIDLYDRCLVIDCHSFPDRPLPYELADPDSVRPDICIGADDFHTSEELLNAFVTEFRRKGWTVSVNDPFSGALVPGNRYRRDHRVKAIMVEVNRRLYLHEASADPLPGFTLVTQQIKRCCMAAIESFTREERAPGKIE